jgi:MFS family permease
VTRRRAWLPALAWTAVVASIGLSLAGALVAAFGDGRNGGDARVFFVLVIPLIVAASVVGGLVATRRPGNPIGWLLCGFGVFMGFATLAAGYARVAPGDARHGAGQAAAWFANWSYVALTALTIFVLLLFPDGRLPGRRWRWAAWCGGLASAALAVGTALDAGKLTDYPAVTNPVGIGGAAMRAVLLTGEILTVPALVAPVLSVVVRYRRAGDVARRQIKWLAVAGVVVAVTTLGGAAVAVAGAPTLGYSTILLGMISLPVAIGVAILRYRLYDVDRVISRSLGYAMLTVVLAAAYGALVLVGQALFSSFAGGSNLAIAMSTLVVAALFHPLRSRVQRLVDRRFYRRRYDAQRTLEAFGARVRAQVDLEALSGDLLGVVGDTMQPAHVSVWLRAEDS